MPLSIQLESKLETELRLRLQQDGIGLSEFVRDAIREKLARTASANTPYELGKDFFGRYASGDTQRSVQRKSLLREKLQTKQEATDEQTNRTDSTN